MAVAIITGASGGIGSDFARELKGIHGVDEFWFVARNVKRMEALRDELAVKTKIIKADLGTREGIEEYRRALTEEAPRVSFLVNCAGFGNFGAFDQLSEAEVEGMIDVNIKATVLLTHMTVPYMEKGGRIIQLGSGSCFTPLPYFNIYSSSKVFVLHYTKSLNYELKKYGIRATCFCPGWVDTEFLPKSTADVTVPTPKKMKPLLNSRRVVKGCVRAALRGRAMFVTNWYTKLQHMLFKLTPDPILTRTWLGMLKYPKEGTSDETK